MLTFGQAVLLFGAFAIGVPILIHLLNRMRFKVVEWAAMRFLLQAHKEERRRVQFESWLLLLLRCLVVLLLVFAVADPAIRYTGGLGMEKTERIVLLDDTYSMGHAPRNESAFDRAKIEAVRLVESLAANRASDTVNLVLASRPEKPVFERELALTDKNVALFREKVQGLRPSDLARPAKDYLADFEANILTGPEEDGEEKPSGNRVVYFFSDFRRIDWQAGEWVAGLSRPSAAPGLAPDVPWVLADVGPADPENLSIVGVQTAPRQAIAGIEFKIDVRVANHGKRQASDVRVSLAIGSEIEKQLSIERIEPGETRAGELANVVIQASGEYAVVARLSADSLGADNIYYSSVEVLPDHRLLLVDDDPPIGIARETYFLERALRPRGQVRSGLAPHVVNTGQLRDIPSLSPYSAVYLCNVRPLPEKQVREIEDYVRSGGAAVFFLGDQVAAGEYNEIFYKDGKGLFPYALKAAEDLVDAAAAGQEAAHITVDPGAEKHPVLTQFQLDMGKRLLRAVPIHRAFSVEEDREANPASQVLLRYTDASSNVALAEKTFGQGRVFLFTTTADRGTENVNAAGWSGWPTLEPGFSYLIVQQELCLYVLANRPSEPVRRPGARIRFPLDAARYKKEVTIVPHAESEGAVGYQEPAKGGTGEEKGLWVSYEETERAGLYQFQFAPKEGGDTVNRFVAVSLDPRDGNLDKVGQPEVISTLSAIAEAKGLELGTVRYYELSHETGAKSWLEFLEEKSRIWQWVVAALMFFVLFETTYAWRIGNR